MRIGMTYDLRDDYLAAGMSEEETAEFDKIGTIEAIENAIRTAGHETVRIGNITSLVKRLASNESWDLVFNIAEGLHGFGREAQVPALLDAYQIPYVFSGPLVQAVTLHKGISKHVVRDSGLPTPAFAVVNCREEIAGIDLPYPLFAKPVAEGTGKGVTAASKITDSRMLQTTCENLLATFKQPVLVETFLPGREFTVGIVGNSSDARSLGVLEVVLLADSEPDVYSYHNKANFENLVEYHAVDDAEAQKAAEVALACYRALGCNDAGRVDLRSDGNGLPNFIEINSLAGLHPEISDLSILAGKHGVNYQQLISSILNAAIKRLGLK
ncbi:D-alanine--D-alanine ligase [Desulfopila sp. IMCC35006]|uniref:D-alanine--D-alanine ligase family protein n=1 Tax=Desulfopila sp. IMCC35006 TaxID=2569542 RepID=UPI0010AD9F85|nr:D-alanine--D-alanine ligase [Desulfopila sp. IMCC35006]TKB26956.1 D-alanine--D-alanine ligase [Desulfopila sp. IMCC35006]